MSADKPTTPTGLQERADTLEKEDGKVWREGNREAIDEYNAPVAKRGVFGDGRRRF